MAVVFWPQRAALRDECDRDAALPQQQHTLLGFRADQHTLCVVALARDEQDACFGAQVVGHATLVSPQHREQLEHGRVSTESHAAAAARDDTQLMCAAHVVLDRSRTRWWHAARTHDAPSAVVCYLGDGDASSSNHAPQRCTVVLYDEELAATGWLSRCGHALASTSALRAPLLQLGAYFEARVEQQHEQRVRNGARSTLAHASQSIIEWVGYYAVFVPSTGLQRVATLIDDCATARLPQSLPAVGSKCAKDASRFLELLSCYMHALAQSPRAVREFYLLSRARRATDAEVTHVLEAWNFLCYVAMDVAVGRLLATVVFQLVVAQLQAYDLSPAAFLNALRSHVVWLMGAPAGFKLNAPLASILGNGILLWFDLWEYALSLLVSDDSPWGALVQLTPVRHAAAVVWRHVGATLQLTLLADALALVTWNSYWVYQYFTKLNMLQLGLFSSLWKLFLGKKNNVLRKRVDSCEYDVSQLLLGTLLFTILFFVVTTNMVFFVYFGLVRLSLFVMQAALWLPVVALRTVPLASLVYRSWRPTFFLASVRLDARRELTTPTATLELVDVGVGKQRPGDRNAQTQIHATARAREPAAQPHTAYFELVPIAVSATSLFQRLRAYTQALSTQYALGAVARSWFFGNRIAPIPLAVLFDCAPAHLTATAVTAAAVALSPSAQRQQHKEKKDA